MEPTADQLIKLKDKQRGEVQLIRDGSKWNPISKKSDLVNFIKPAKDSGQLLWWAASVGKQVQLLSPAIQLFEFDSPREWARVFSQDGIVRGALGGKAVLSVKVEGRHRWFGVVSISNDMDPRIQESRANELLTSDSLVNWLGRRVLAPGWTPEPLESGISFESRSEIATFLTQVLQPEVSDKVMELAQRLPDLRARLDLDTLAGWSFDDKLVNWLLTYPSFERRFNLIKETAEKEAAAITAEAHASKEVAQAEIEMLRERKIEQIRAAMGDILEDNRLLALASILNIKAQPHGPDLGQIEEALTKLANRQVQSPVDLQPLVDAIGHIREVDLTPIVNAIQALPVNRTPSGVPSANETIDTPSSTAQSPRLSLRAERLSGPDEIAECFQCHTHRALLISAHAGVMGVVVGPRAPETLQNLFKAICAGRSIWWPVPADIVDVRRVTSDPSVRELLETARQDPDRLYSLVFEGIDRAPTEAYLEPLLVLRDIGSPLPSTSEEWPKNVLLFATKTQGGRTVLPIAPGIWERAIPVTSDVYRVRDRSEIAPSFWLTTSTSKRTCDLTGLVPNHVSCPIIDSIGRSAAHLGLDVPACLLQGIAAATCLSLGNGTKASGGAEKTFAALFT